MTHKPSAKEQLIATVICQHAQIKMTPETRKLCADIIGINEDYTRWPLT